MSNNNRVSMYQYGNTVRFKCTFYDFDNNKIIPDIVKIIIYNHKYEVVHEVKIDDEDSDGAFIYEYITEKKRQRLYYEWYGEINGKPSLKRGEFITDFI